jgi:hypothetical protein
MDILATERALGGGEGAGRHGECSVRRLRHSPMGLCHSIDFFKVANGAHSHRFVKQSMIDQREPVA